jgi:hypothetical protein
MLILLKLAEGNWFIMKIISNNHTTILISGGTCQCGYGGTTLPGAPSLPREACIQLCCTNNDMYQEL